MRGSSIGKFLRKLICLSECDNRDMQPLMATMTVSGPFGQYTVEAVVDTEATFSRVPAPALIELGIQPHRIVRMQSTDGTAQFRQLGRALTTVESHEDIVPVLFGEPGEPAVIGATTLASCCCVATRRPDAWCPWKRSAEAVRPDRHAGGSTWDSA